MCGINLILDKHQKLWDHAPILAMNEAIRHRGPDATDYLIIHTAERQILLGHNRLKILDLSDQANQPFVSNCGNFILLYNGEIYNYEELRQKLPKKYTFKTNSDTEVLIYWLIEHLDGKKIISEALAQLHGMYAFVLLDRQKDRLFIARDPHMIKPLYFAEQENYLIISSEIKGILASGLIPKQLNTVQVQNYLCFKYALKPETFFQGVYEFGKAVFYDLQKNIFQTIPAYTQPPDFQAYNYALLPIEATLQTSLRYQIQANVPVGLFLSGGVDSTLLLALMTELKPHEKIPVFSLANLQSEANFGTQDYHFARKAAEQYGGEYVEVSVNQDHLQELPQFWMQMDQPIADGASYLTHLLSQEAVKSVKVVLSGAGADEWFGGYHRHWAYRKYLQHYPWLKYLLPFLKNSARFVQDGLEHPLRKYGRLYKKFVRQIDSNPLQTWVNFMQIQTNPACAVPQIIKELFVEVSQPSDFLGKAFQADRELFLPLDVLKISDEMSMRHSLELRVPYLDDQVIDIIARIPPEYLLQKGKKWLLKKILNRRQGQAYTQRKKEGFGMPFGHWLRQNPQNDLIYKLRESNHLLFECIDQAFVLQCLKAHLSGKADFSQELWAWLGLGYWIENRF
ncbi:MAG: asparagine synthase (glutamine-hydrolyzing) [Microscillaceae bacterium]|nr:asparagine synthase (glutamine-hydrolyzing) [Microscillaceae bacterium]